MKGIVFAFLGIVVATAAGCSAGNAEDENADSTSDALLRVCGGVFPSSCGPRAYCNTPPGRCAGPKQRGQCAPRPQLCPDIFEPVCGCDGNTYPNECQANAAGTDVASQGECEGSEAPVMCGGIAGIPCPGAGQCVDDPSDDCDPQRGGADCGGICQCIETVLCIRGTHFDSSPGVCACVPDAATEPCAGVRCRAGTHCESSGDAIQCVPNDGASCGDATCPAGMYCCNASCGMCAPPGVACIQIACK